MSLKLRNGLIGLGIVLVVLFGCYSCFSGNYNNLVTMDEQVNAQWAQVENQYQRRYDLIPNLVATVKGFASTDDPEKMAQFQKVQDSLGGALQRLLSVAENYPELKANQNFMALQDELEGTENRIAVERKRYNDAAQEFNTAIRKFPVVFMANTFGFKAKAYFKAAEESKSAPKVEF